MQAISVPSGRQTVQSFGGARAQLSTVAGALAFVSSDDRFSGLLAPSVAAAEPIRIYRFDGSRFIDATPRFRNAVTTDAARWWQRSLRARRARADARGPFAAWAADTCLLGGRATVTRELARAVAAGVFSAPRVESGPAGPNYAAVLRRELRAWGYCR